MPEYSSRTINIRLRATNLAESTIAHPEMDDRKIAKQMAEACRAVLADGLVLQEKAILDPLDGKRLRFIGVEPDMVPSYFVKALSPVLMGVRESFRTKVSSLNSESAGNTDSARKSDSAASKLLMTAPLGLAIDICLGPKAAGEMHRNAENNNDFIEYDQDIAATSQLIRYDVLVNGTVIDSDFVVPPSASDEPIHIIVSGKRVDKALERPIILCPPNLTAKGELLEARANRINRRLRNSEQRWDAINDNVRSVATELEHWGSVSPLSAFLHALAEEKLPDELKDVPGRRPVNQNKGQLFGTIDVIISRGRGQRARWWKKLDEVTRPMEYTSLKHARDKGEKDEDGLWYAKYVQDHVKTQKASRLRMTSNGVDEAGYEVSDEDTAPQTTSSGAFQVSDQAAAAAEIRGPPTKRAKLSSVPHLTIPGPGVVAGLRIDSPMEPPMARQKLTGRPSLQELIDRAKRPDKARLNAYILQLRDEWRSPKLCTNSLLTFAEDGIWCDGGRGGHLRHVGERRVARFDDDEVVHAVRYVLGLSADN